MAKILSREFFVVYGITSYLEFKLRKETDFYSLLSTNRDVYVVCFVTQSLLSITQAGCE